MMRMVSGQWIERNTRPDYLRAPLKQGAQSSATNTGSNQILLKTFVSITDERVLVSCK